MYERKYFICVNSHFSVIFTSYKNVCTATKFCFMYVDITGKQKQQNQECQEYTWHCKLLWMN